MRVVLQLYRESGATVEGFMLRSISLLTLVSLFSGPLRAIVVASGDPNSSSVVVAYNQVVDGVNLNGVVELDTSSGVGCSGSLLSDGYSILTAGHCVASLTAPCLRATSMCISRGRAVLSKIRRPPTTSIRAGRETPRRATTWPSFASIKPLRRLPPGTRFIPGYLPTVQSCWPVTARLELGRPAAHFGGFWHIAPRPEPLRY